VTNALHATIVVFGKVIKVAEYLLDQSEKNKTGYLPDGYEGTDLGVSTITGWTQALH